MREMSIGENYERKLTPIRSNISRFSRSTVVPLCSPKLLFDKCVKSVYRILCTAEKSYGA